jgi:uncharacterized membrane protein YgcG
MVIFGTNKFGYLENAYLKQIQDRIDEQLAAFTAANDQAIIDQRNLAAWNIKITTVVNRQMACTDNAGLTRHPVQIPQIPQPQLGGVRRAGSDFVTQPGSALNELANSRPQQPDELRDSAAKYNISNSYCRFPPRGAADGANDSDETMNPLGNESSNSKSMHKASAMDSGNSGDVPPQGGGSNPPHAGGSGSSGGAGGSGGGGFPNHNNFEHLSSNQQKIVLDHRKAALEEISARAKALGICYDGDQRNGDKGFQPLRFVMV